MDSLKWLQEWYIQNCDGDWEHCYGIEIFQKWCLEKE